MRATKDFAFDITTTLVPIVDDIVDVDACNNYTLPTITGTNLTGNESYYTLTGGTGTALAAGTILTTSQTVFIYDATTAAPVCSDEEDFTITINTAPTVSNIARVCNAGNADYVVSFDIAGGNGGIIHCN